MKPPSATDPLRFFHDLSGILEIELDIPTSRMPGLSNEVADPAAGISSLRFSLKTTSGVHGHFRALTADEEERIMFEQRRVVLCSSLAVGKTREYTTSNLRGFSVRELRQAIEDLELATRSSTEWLEGVDVHHVLFDGLSLEKPGVLMVLWGS